MDSNIKKRKLYEYEDDLRILYPFGYLKNVKKYYQNDPYFQVYNFVENCVKKPTFWNKIYKSSPEKIWNYLKRKI